MKIFGRKALSVFFCGSFLLVLTSAAAGQNIFRKINDYDGDGKTDIAIWRAGAQQSTFWVYGSQVGVFALPWGVSTDTVVRY